MSSGIWDDDLEARLEQAELAERDGDLAASRAIAAAMVAEHFEDPPEGETDAVVDAAFLLARLQAEVGEEDAAFALLERVIGRHAGPGAPDGERIAALAHTRASRILAGWERLDEALERAVLAVALPGEPEDHWGRWLLADAMAVRAELLVKGDRLGEAAACCREVIERFGDEDDPEIAEVVEWARGTIGYGFARSGHRLHGRIGNGPEAESAYRRAIVAGSGAAAASLGGLLLTARGREAEAEALLRGVIESGDREPAAFAALELGIFLFWHRADPESARPLLRLAAAADDEEVAGGATATLGYLEAFEGDRATARAGLRAFADHMDRRLGAELGERTKERLAEALAGVAANRLTGPLWRGQMRARHRLLRRWWRVSRWSRPARLVGRAGERVRPAGG